MPTQKCETVAIYLWIDRLCRSVVVPTLGAIGRPRHERTVEFLVEVRPLTRSTSADCLTGIVLIRFVFTVSFAAPQTELPK